MPVTPAVPSAFVMDHATLVPVRGVPPPSAVRLAAKLTLMGSATVELELTDDNIYELRESAFAAEGNLRFIVTAVRTVGDRRILQEW